MLSLVVVSKLEELRLLLSAMAHDDTEASQGFALTGKAENSSLRSLCCEQLRLDGQCACLLFGFSE